jgi:tRNA threonylcarbamoyladenosine biosynthesis protein TsaB
MALILCIETATPVCSVAFIMNKEVIALKESQEKNAHSSSLTLFIQELFKETGFKPADLDAVAVSRGPGSYTGLRIGVSTAKGFSYGLDIPVIAVDTLQSMALGMIRQIDDQTLNVLFCPMIDARRMEVYNALFDHTGKQIRETLAEIITETAFDHYMNQQKIHFFGDGAAKCKSLIRSANAVFHDDFQPSAAHMADFALNCFIDQVFEDTAYFEPFYLKDFIAGVPKVKGL